MAKDKEDYNDPELHLKFRSGNVVRLRPDDKSLVLIYRTCNDGCSWICFDYENSSGFTPAKSKPEIRACSCESYDERGEYDGHDPECETCHGEGQYTYIRPGMDKAKVVASHVKEYIMKRLTKNFDF